jgi:hypothetical protein
VLREGAVAFGTTQNLIVEQKRGYFAYFTSLSADEYKKLQEQHKPIPPDKKSHSATTVQGLLKLGTPYWEEYKGQL